MFQPLPKYSLLSAASLRTASRAKKVVNTLFPRSRMCSSSSLMPWCSMAKKMVLRMMQRVTITSKKVSLMMAKRMSWVLSQQA